MTGVAAVLGRIGDGLFQHAWVVEDLPAAEAAMGSALGCGEFVGFEMDQEWDFRGEKAQSAMACGFARSGNVQIELMQPLRGDGIVAEFLERHGPGPHHFGILVDDLDEVVAAAAEDGVPAVASAGFGAVRVCFLDTVDVLGLYLELIEDPTGMLAATMPWRD